MDHTLEQRNAGTDGFGVAWAHHFCQVLGLHGIRVIERVAAATSEYAGLFNGKTAPPL